MESGRKEYDRNSLGRIAVVIASRVDILRIVSVIQLIVERQRLCERSIGLNDKVVKIGADPIGADKKERVAIVAFDVVAVIPPDHVHIELSLDLLEWNDREV